MVQKQQLNNSLFVGQGFSLAIIKKSYYPANYPIPDNGGEEWGNVQRANRHSSHSGLINIPEGDRMRKGLPQPFHIFIFKLTCPSQVITKLQYCSGAIHRTRMA